MSEVPHDLRVNSESDALTGLMHTIVDGVITIDSRGRIIDFNPACEILFGFAASEVVGRNVNMLMPSPYQHEHDGYLANYQQTGERKIIGIGREVMGQRKDGTTFPMELSVGQIDQGNDRAYVGVIRDLTARTRLEQGLRDSEAQHRAVIETAVDGIIIIDKLGTVRMYNPACEKMFGFVAETVIGQNIRMLMPSPYFDEHDRYLQDYGETHNRKIIGIGREVIGRRMNGTTFPIELSVGETTIGGRPLFVGVLRDITQNKAADEALRAARHAADQANQAKSEFLAIVSHEIRTPMNAVLGFARMLDEAGLVAPHADYANMIVRAGDALMVILNDILDLAKIEAGRIDFEKLPFQVASELTQIEELWSPPARQKGIYLRTSMADDMPQTVIGDPVRVRQVLFNLVNNAVKFTSHGGVSVIAKSTRGGSGNIEIRFEVTDTGVGVPLEKQAIIFDAFTQADSSTNRRFGGTGLGLNICKRLVDMMGGTIGVESSSGGGAKFWFALTCQEAEMIAPDVEPASVGVELAATRLRVLLAEDHAMNQKMIRIMLEAAGHDVFVVEDGLQALHAIRNGVYDVVLMDISMPTMDGVEATRRIRELEGPERLVPIIALTANAMKGDREKFLAAGMTDYLSKPIHIRSLIAALERQRGSPSIAA